MISSRILVGLALLIFFAQPAEAGSWSRVRGSIENLGSRETLSTLAGGAALAYATTRIEDPDRMSVFFAPRNFGHAPSLGNRYGENTTIGAGLAGLWLGGVVSGHDRLSRAAEDGLLAVLIAGSISTTLKVAVGRTRPDGGPHAFPSGHTSIAAALAPVLEHHFGSWVGLAAYTLPALTAAGRIQERRHFPSDVIFGYAVGLAAGRAVVRSGNTVRFGVTPRLAYAQVAFF